MKKTALLILLSLGIISFIKSQNTLTQIQVDVAFLSSDYLEGRASGTAGAEMAAQYIARRFKECGLKPAGDRGSWYQEYNFKESANPHEKEGSGKSITSKNVVGFLDNNAKYTVIIGAHYDHLGWGGHGSRHTGDSSIHNGADDNASGTTGLFIIAEMLKKSSAKKNNYLFIAFSGEEMGLYGSKAYVAKESFDTSVINYMLNMDMIGRLNAERTLVVNGTGTSPSWKELDKIKVKGISGIKTTESGIGPSDHTSFYLKGIPVLHFFTGQHRDYHKPSDDANLINYDGLEAVCKFMHQLIEQVDAKGKLKFIKTKDEDQGKKAARFKVTLGVMPDYVYDGKGMRIDAVIDGGAAGNAGLEDGDVVIGIGEMDVKEIYSYMEALSKFNKGDSTVVKIRRGEEELEKKVTF